MKRTYKNLMIVGGVWLTSAIVFSGHIDDSFVTTIGIMGGALTFLMGAVNLWEE